MRTNHIAAAIAAFLSCAILCTWCVQSPTWEADGAGGGTPTAEIDDEAELGSSTVGSEPPAGSVGSTTVGERPHDPSADDERIGEAVGAESKDQCIEACKGGADSMAAFCRSLPPDPRLRAGCWGVVLAGETACIGWCLWHF